jgi:formylglycine-generating enzyme
MADQVWVRGGGFQMGSDRHYPDEGPSRHVSVDGFSIDPTPITNERFAEFVDETGHVTLAELAPRAEDYPGARPEDLVPGSLVFTPTAGPVNLDDYHQWWSWTHGADWRHPTGPDSSLDGLEGHPVVHVAYQDAAAFADWAGQALPTEAEWEYAARGGLNGAEFTWGEGDPQDTPKPKANTWQGAFPYENTEVDGWTRTSPVGSFEANGYGLYDMAGNVWEWTSEWYSGRGRRPEHSCCAPTGGPSEGASYDPAQPQVRIPRKVVKGGSHLCTIQYCFRYRPAARQPQMVDTSTSHIGFRCVTRSVNG